MTVLTPTATYSVSALAQTLHGREPPSEGSPAPQGLSLSGHPRKATAIRQKEEEELQMALAVSASEAAAVAAALQEPISIEDAEVRTCNFMLRAGRRPTVPNASSSIWSRETGVASLPT